MLFVVENKQPKTEIWCQNSKLCFRRGDYRISWREHPLIKETEWRLLKVSTNEKWLSATPKETVDLSASKNSDISAIVTPQYGRIYSEIFSSC